MAITAAGVGSGLDIEGIVSQLMALERRPLTTLQQKGFEYKTQLSAYGVLKSAVSSFKSAMDGLASLDKFRLFSATSSDTDVLSATAKSSAANGTFDIEVVRLAQRHKMASSEIAEGATFSGSLTLTVGTQSLNLSNLVDVTLEDIRDQINTSENNPGLTASIIMDETTGNQRLTLTADDEGFDASIQESGDLATSLGLSTINTGLVNGLEDLNAEIIVDTFTVNSSSNNVSSVVEGVTFELKSLGTATINVNRDTAGITASVKAFVDAYNSIQTTINGMRAEDGPLAADNVTLSMQRQIRQVFNSSPTGLTNPTYNFLSELGITTNADTGQLEFDSSKLEEALDENFNNVAELFALEDQGFASRLSNLADSFLASDGLIDSRQDGLNSRIKANETLQERAEYRLEKKELALRKQYASLDSMLGSMQAMSTYLTNAFSSFQSNN